MSTEEDDQDVDSGWDSDRESMAGDKAKGGTPPAARPPAAKPGVVISTTPSKAPLKPSMGRISSAGMAAVKPPIAVRPPPGTSAPKVIAPAKPLAPAPKPVTNLLPPKPAPNVAPVKPAPSAAPPKPAPNVVVPKPAAPRPAAAAPAPVAASTANVPTSPPAADAPAAEASPASSPAPKSRTFTPRVTNAVQQAKELDTEATYKPPIRRPTPMRVPTSTATAGAAPTPDLPPKLPTTTLRFSDEEGGRSPDARLPPKRKETMKLNAATQDFALEMSNQEADVYSQRARSKTAEPEGERRISADELDLHLGDFSLDDRKSSKPPVKADERGPSTARSETAKPKAPVDAKPPLDAGGLRPPAAPKPQDKDLSARLAPPRLPNTGIRAAAGFRVPGPDKLAAEASRAATPAAAPASAGSAPTKPPPPQLPTPVPPTPADDEPPLITMDDAGDLDVSIPDDLDGLEVDLDAKPAPNVSLHELDDLSLDSVPPKQPPAASPSRPEGPVSADPATVRGGPDDDPSLAPIRERFERKDYMGALMRAEALLAQVPDHAGAKYFATTCQDRVKELYISRLGSSTSVPRVVMSPNEIQALALDHRSGFLISIIDGYATVDDVLDISGMPFLEALRLLYELKNEGVIDT